MVVRVYACMYVCVIVRVCCWESTHIVYYVMCVVITPCVLLYPQAKNSHTNEVVAVKKMNFSGKQSAEVS